MTHDWQRGVNQFSTATEDAYEFVCLRCGLQAYLETGRRGDEPRPLPTSPCQRAEIAAEDAHKLRAVAAQEGDGG